MFATLNNKTMQNNKFDEFNNRQQKIAAFAKVLSHPARIAIIELLAEKKEIKTGNISNYLPIGRTTVSRHLKELKNAGIIKGETDGLKIHYCLDMERLKEIKSLFNHFIDQAISSFVCDC
jgi:DNA-binding transcriptional ArsR family regulator